MKRQLLQIEPFNLILTCEMLKLQLKQRKLNINASDSGQVIPANIVSHQLKNVHAMQKMELFFDLSLTFHLPSWIVLAYSRKL